MTSREVIANVECSYAVAAKRAHLELTLEGTAAIWSAVIKTCDQAISNIPSLKADDLKRILAFRDAAQTRRDLHS
jgi:hypothetical protein